MKNKASVNQKIVASLLVFTIAFMSTSSFMKTQVRQEQYAAMVKQSLPKTVTIFVEFSRIGPESHKKETAKVLGSGVFISKNGHILTCNHLFSVSRTIESIIVLTANNEIMPATLLAQKEKMDLALIKVNLKSTPYASLASPDSLQVGQEVVAIGSPLGLIGTVTTGVISSLHRDDSHYDMIQMSAPINPGNSGGPLFGLTGELLGINVLMYSPNPVFPTWSGIGFSVSASEINRFLVELRENYKGL